MRIVSASLLLLISGAGVDAARALPTTWRESCSPHERPLIGTVGTGLAAACATVNGGLVKIADADGKQIRSAKPPTVGWPIRLPDGALGWLGGGWVYQLESSGSWKKLRVSEPADVETSRAQIDPFSQSVFTSSPTDAAAIMEFLPAAADWLEAEDSKVAVHVVGHCDGHPVVLAWRQDQTSTVPSPVLVGYTHRGASLNRGLDLGRIWEPDSLACGKEGPVLVFKSYTIGRVGIGTACVRPYLDGMALSAGYAMRSRDRECVLDATAHLTVVHIGADAPPVAELHETPAGTYWWGEHWDACSDPVDAPESDPATDYFVFECDPSDSGATEVALNEWFVSASVGLLPGGETCVAYVPDQGHRLGQLHMTCDL